MKIDIVTLFPQVCAVPLGESIMGRAQAHGALELAIHDLRPFGIGRHRKCDDVPYGGGQGMVLRPEPFFACVEPLRTEASRVVMMSPQGRRFDQAMARNFATEEHLIILSGHYEGVDHRVIEGLVDDEISIGDYVLTNGTIAAAVFVDAIIRLLPGVLGDERSPVDESFSEDRLLEAPAYTRPPEFRGMQVPEVLLSGHHARIVEWKREQALRRTRENRPELLEETSDEHPTKQPQA